MFQKNSKKFNSKFSSAKHILEKLCENGYEAYFVGGCVRDYILNKEFSDIDITTNALPTEVKKIFSKVIDTGIQHGTVTVLHNGNSYEITTFRMESDYYNHRTPRSVEFVSNLEEDLKRRDFTINSMAFDKDGNLIDINDGLLDIKNKLVRTVNEPNERFEEDALRMLRAFRFSSKLSFDIDERTYFAICKNANLIKFISIERIVSEFRKLLAGKGNVNSMNLFIKSGLANHIPVIKDITIYKDCSNYTFTQSLYYLSYLNNISIENIKSFKLSNNEIKKIKTYGKIYNEFINNTPIELILYNYKKEDAIFIVNIFNFMSTENIENIFLTINSFSDVDITIPELIKIIEKPAGSWVKDIVKTLEKNILLKKINNNYTEIVDFLKKLRDNI